MNFAFLKVLPYLPSKLGGMAREQSKKSPVFLRKMAAQRREKWEGELGGWLMRIQTQL